MAKPVTIYKTTILYLLDRSSCPLSNLQISDFFLQGEYTDYFKVQEVLAELAEFGLIEELSTHENTQYVISARGKETLSFLQDKLNYELKEDVKRFFEKNEMQFRLDNSIYSDYRKVGTDAYQVTLNIREENAELLSVSMQVRTKEQAEAICDNWKASSDEVYAILMDCLVK